MRRPQLYIGRWLLVVMFWYTACTGARERTETETTVQDYRLRERQHVYSATYQDRLPQGAYHYFDKTEVDLEYDRSEPASHYHRPHGARGYVYDATEVDLAMPLPSLPSPSAPTAGEETVPEERNKERSP